MQKGDSSASLWRDILVIQGSLLVIGAGLGWMIGLSVSPVVSIVISAVGTLAATVVATIIGMQERPKWEVNPLPLAILVIGLLIGSTLGILARTHNLLGADTSPAPMLSAGELAAEEAQKWMAAGLELEQAEIVLRLFEHAYSVPPAAMPVAQSEPSTITPQSGGFLFAVPVEQCALLLATRGADLRSELRVAVIEPLQILPDLIDDDIILERLVAEVLCAGES